MLISIILYALVIYFSLYRLVQGLKIYRNKEYTYKRRLPDTLFSKATEVTIVDKSARIVAIEWLSVGIITLILLSFHLIAGWLHIQSLIVLVLVITIVLDIMGIGVGNMVAGREEDGHNS